MHSELINAILKDAPMLASALVSPAAGMAINVLASFFGGQANDPDGLAAKIVGDTASSDKLQSLDMQFKSLLGHGSRPMSSIKFNLEINYANEQSESKLNGNKSSE